MISESVLENSVFLLWLKQLPAQYDNLNRRINMFYLDSWSYKINTGFRNAVALAFKYSFIGKASQVDNLADKIDFGVFGGSILLKSLFYFYSVYKIKISGYFNSSLVISSIQGLSSDLYCLRVVGVIAVTAILVNLILAIIFKNEIGLYGWIIRVLLFLIGVAAVNSPATWQGIKNTSFFLKGR